jgi:hypothetical protein
MLVVTQAEEEEMHIFPKCVSHYFQYFIILEVALLQLQMYSCEDNQIRDNITE